MDLETNKVDYIVSGVRATLSSIPYVGPFIAETICVFIPNQRIDRVCKLAEFLADKIETIESEKIVEIFKNPYFIDLLEDSVIQSSKALTDERLIQISSLLSKGISAEQLPYEKIKRFLSLLSQLTDTEVIILASLVYTHRENSEYHDNHKNVLNIEIPTFASSDEVIERYAIHESHKQHLSQLGLLEPRYEIEHSLGIPKFDSSTGKMKISGYVITELGKGFVKYIETIP